MLSVTEAASAHLAQILKQQDAPNDIGVRLICEGQDIALQEDGQRAGDSTFQHDGQTVLLLDAPVSELLAEDTLDIEGARLTLQYP